MGGMKPRGVVAIVVAVSALAAPASAHAIDYALQLAPSKVPEAAAPAGWRLNGLIVKTAAAETFGLTLNRTFHGGRAEESHGLRAAVRVGTVKFDGVRGTWDTQKQVGQVASIRMSIRATGAPQRFDEAWGCRGSFARVGVVLRGTLVLRTGTRFFRTIRRSQLRGTLTYRTGGTADCSVAPATVCTPLTDLRASRNFDDVYATPDAGGSLAVSFREGGATGPVWYHRMTVAGVVPFAGKLPALDVRVPSGHPIQGRGTFTARETSESTVGGCGVTTTRGSFTGTFRVRFTGWGARTLTVNTNDASYRVSG